MREDEEEEAWPVLESRKSTLTGTVLRCSQLKAVAICIHGTYSL